MPDANLARKIGVSLDAVKAERRRRRVEPFRPKIPDVVWTPKMTRWLGADTDNNIADRLGLTEHVVRRKRRIMGIAPFDEGRQRKVVVWTGEKIALLGSDVDRVIAKGLGVSVPTVAIKRTELGIKSFYPQRRIRWTRKMAALLGKVTDWKIATQYKISRTSVARERQRRGIPPRVVTLPIERTPDLKSILSQPIRSISRRYKISSETIAKLRRELRVPTPKRWLNPSKAISPR
jgi:hypothetical protein